MPEHVIDFHDSRPTTMVRVPGSFGDSGFHRESTNQEETKVKAEPEIEASTEGESPSTPLNEVGFADRQSAGRSSDDVKKEEDSAMNLEEKPRLPPQTPSGVPADHDEHREPPDEGLSAKADGSSPTSNPSRARSASKKSKKARASKKKMKAPVSDAEDRDEPETWTNAQLEQFEDALERKKLQAFLVEDSVMKIMRLKIVGTLRGPVTAPVVTTDKLDAIKMLMHLLKEAGIVQGAFEVNELFDRDVSDIMRSTMALHLMLTPLVGSTKIEIDTAPAVSPRSPEYQTGSSQYASATSEAESETSVDLQRMTLGPSGAAMLQQRKMKEETIPQQPVLTASSFVAPDRGPADRMQSFFNAAMDRFLTEQHTPEAVPAAQFTRPTRTSAGVPSAPGAAATAKAQGTQDVEMESVGSRHSELADEYDPDDLSLEAPRRAAVASAGATSGNISTPQRIRVSAIYELKDFPGKDGDVDRARSWIGKAKSAFLRDQAPDSEKCLVFGDLMSGPARNWYRQLARSI
ncbi:hypothetical protein PF003_g37290 [Phytophthora fragariae]|nr:hypothetical protein PF003_g37290 [Phytophthora fragariae]